MARREMYDRGFMRYKNSTKYEKELISCVDPIGGKAGALENCITMAEEKPRIDVDKNILPGGVAALIQLVPMKTTKDYFNESIANYCKTYLN